MATSEIEKLERRYAENPHGLTFAPLAEIHRKNGDIPRALELLRIGLELHPNYIPASIVLGRCHQDLGDLPAAEEAFSHVLRLDDENVIALKSLADINERQDKLEDAEQWLRRLVSVDRSNEEARLQLQHLETLKLRSRRRAAPAPAPAPAVETSHEVAITAAPAEAPSKEPTAASAPLESLDLTEELARGGDAVSQPVKEPRPEPVAPEVGKTPVPEPPQPEPAVSATKKVEPAQEPAPISGLVPAEFEPPKEPPKSLSPLGLEIETEEDVVLRSSGATEFSVPDASQDLLEIAARLNASQPRSPGRRATDRAEAERKKPKAPAPPPPIEVEEPTPIAAELQAPARPTRSYVARETRGQSIADFFRALLAARPPEESRAPGTSPSSAVAGSIHPNQDGHLSTKDSAVSFDDFFGSGSKSPTAPPPGGTEPSKDDLDQFQSWLQNLKR